MSEEQQDVWQLVEMRVAQHVRDGWKEIQRWDDPPRVRMRKVQPPRKLPLGMVVRSKAYGQRVYCRDITIGDAGKVTWGNVPCESDDKGARNEPG